MAYTQSPANVLKGQMTNKAVGLAHGDSMAMQTDPKDGVTVTAKKKDPDTKQDLLKLIKSQQEYDINRRTKVTPELAEIDSLTMVAKGDYRGAKEMYGPKYEAKTGRLPSSVTLEKRRELRKKAEQIQGPRPSL